MPEASPDAAATVATLAPHQDFHEWLADHARGTLDNELTAELAELVKAVSELEKPGTLTLQLKVDVAGSGGRTVFIAGKVTSKPPVPAPEASIFYVGDGGTLHRDDPYSPRLTGVPFQDTAGDLKVVDPDTGELRKVDE